MLDLTQGSQPTLSGRYGDGSSWSGFETRIALSVTNTILNTSLAPVIAITQQSTNPPFLSSSNGLIGFGFSSLSSFSDEPRSIFDALAISNQLNRQVGFRACPYSSTNKGWIDIGNTEGYNNCGLNGPVAYIQVPTKTYHTVNILSISVNDVPVSLPSTFQTTDNSLVGGSQKAWSFFDSCSSVIRVPSVVLTSLQSAIKSSTGLSFLTTTQLNNFLSGSTGFKTSSQIQFDALPKFTVEMASKTSTETVKLILGPRQYIQTDSDGYCKLPLYRFLFVCCRIK